MSHFNTIANSWDTEEKIALNLKFAQAIKDTISKEDFTNILEIGCGTGLLSAGFINEKVNFLGVDTSEAMLEIFNQKYILYPNVKSQLINIEKNDLKISNVDLVISSMAFHHLEHPVSLLRKIKSYLAKDAIISFIDLDKEDGTFHSNPKKMGVHHFGFSEVEVKNWGNELGYKIFKRSILFTFTINEKQFPIYLNIFMN